MRKFYCLMLTISISLGMVSCCFIPYPIKTDSYKIFFGEDNVHVSNAYIKKHTLGLVPTGVGSWLETI